MKAISIRPPWAWAIFYAGKDVENRSWPTKVRGRVAIQATGGMTRGEYNEACQYVEKFNERLKRQGASFFDKALALLGKRTESQRPEIQLPAYELLVQRAIVGTVEVVDCVQHSDSVWFEGGFGFVLAKPQRLLEPIPCKGALGFWNVPAEIEARIMAMGSIE